jgi:DNA topoisomerase II
LNKTNKANVWEITEIPIGVSTDKVKAHLEYLYTGASAKGAKKNAPKKSCISNINWKGTTNTVYWSFKVAKDFIPDINVADNFKILQTSKTFTNMHMLDENGYPKKYSSPEEILRDFCPIRLRDYGKRRNYWMSEYQKLYEKAKNKYQYIVYIREGKLNMGQGLEAAYKAMQKLGLKKLDFTKKDGEEDAEEIEEKKGKENEDGYDYLTSITTKYMTNEYLLKLKNDMVKYETKVKEFTDKTPVQAFKEDLAAVRVAWKKFLKTRKEE